MHFSVGISKNCLTLELTRSSDKSTACSHHSHQHASHPTGQLVFESTILLPDGSSLRFNSRTLLPSSSGSSIQQESKVAHRKSFRFPPKQSFRRHVKQMYYCLSLSKQGSCPKKYQLRQSELPADNIQPPKAGYYGIEAGLAGPVELDGATCRAELPAALMMDDEPAYPEYAYNGHTYERYYNEKSNHARIQETYLPNQPQPPPASMHTEVEASPSFSYANVPEAPGASSSVSPNQYFTDPNETRLQSSSFNVTGKSFDRPRLSVFVQRTTPQYDAANRQAASEHHSNHSHAFGSPVSAFDHQPVSADHPHMGIANRNMVVDQLITPDSTSQSSFTGSYDDHSPAHLTPNGSLQRCPLFLNETPSPYGDSFSPTVAVGVRHASNSHSDINTMSATSPIKSGVTTLHDHDYYRDWAAGDCDNIGKWGRQNLSEYFVLQQHAASHRFDEEPPPQYMPRSSESPSTWETTAERTRQSLLQPDNAPSHSRNTPVEISDTASFSSFEALQQAKPPRECLLKRCKNKVFPPLECEYCDMQFTGEYQKSNRKRHCRLKHEVSESGSECRVCGKSYRRTDARRKHEWKKHKLLSSKPEKRRKTS